MLASINGVFRLSRDIELKYLPSGKAVAKIGLVNSSKYKTQTGELKEDSCFIDAVIWGGSAEAISQYCKKGSKIYVNGELKQEKWIDQQTQQNRSKHIININSFEFLDSKQDDQQNTPKGAYQPTQQQQQTQQQQKANGYQSQQNIPDIYMDDEEIPF